MNHKMIDVVFQNQDFIVVNKPAGLNFHSEAETENTTQAGLAVLVKQQQQLAELYPVHRLDKMTSGLVIFALNKVTAQAFQILFEQHHIQKYYLAISDKKPKKKQGWVIGDMVSARRGSWKLTQSKRNAAKTQFISALIEPKKRLYLVKPITGKTHQIRVALKSIGSPILGDTRYSETNEAKQLDRGYLHAFAIQFTLYDHPYQFVQSPTESEEGGEEFLNPNCTAIIQSWQQPWCCF
ncbi:Pseudouridine synthase, VC1668 type [hydrothermal vent metagenome]|uniref:Pseudouridine synthase, VC1668 type n=1 Tax=hydrothermal vent metagenome TaxID=652676 RepID=A0A3B0VNJ8_9ZZZZ